MPNQSRWDISLKINHNELRECRVRDCARARHGLSPFCKPHAYAKREFADPCGRRVLSKELKPWRQQADAFLNANREHPGVVKALEFFDALLHAALPDRGRSADQWLARELFRLLGDGVGPWECLVEVVAVAIAHSTYKNERNTLQLSEANYRRTLASRILRLRPFHRYTDTAGKTRSTPPHADVEEKLGRLIMRALGFFLFTIEEHAEALERIRTSIDRALLAQPFALSPARDSEHT